MSCAVDGVVGVDGQRSVLAQVRPQGLKLVGQARLSTARR